MTKRAWIQAAVAVVLAMTVAGPAAVATAKTKKPKKQIVATVNGKRVTWGGRLLSFSQSGSGVIIIGTKIRATKTIGLGCPVLLGQQAYPVTYDTNCSGQYQEKGGRRYWFNTGIGTNRPPFSVTFDSFDGTIVTGHFAGTLPPLTGATDPVAVEGTFSGPVKSN